MPSQATKRNGFTLIELLVVIAIIAILAAILFPVFLSAKNSARKSACQSNLRQLGFAVQAYLDDNQGYWPDSRDYTSAIYRYVKNRDVFKCPNDVLRDKLGAAGSDDERISYARNSETFLECSGHMCRPRLLNASRIFRPTRFVMFVDDSTATDPGKWSAPINNNGFYAVSQAGRHDGMDCYALGDGHVKALSSKSIPDGAEVYEGITWNPALSP